MTQYRLCCGFILLECHKSCFHIIIPVLSILLWLQPRAFRDDETCRAVVACWQNTGRELASRGAEVEPEKNVEELCQR